jgi:hypothetical protein
MEIERRRIKEWNYDDSWNNNKNNLNKQQQQNRDKAGALDKQEGKRRENRLSHFLFLFVRHTAESSVSSPSAAGVQKPGRRSRVKFSSVVGQFQRLCISQVVCPGITAVVSPTQWREHTHTKKKTLRVAQRVYRAAVLCEHWLLTQKERFAILSVGYISTISIH